MKAVFHTPPLPFFVVGVMELDLHHEHAHILSIASKEAPYIRAFCIHIALKSSLGAVDKNGRIVETLQ